MKGLLAKTAAAALVTSSLITLGGNEAQAYGCTATGATTDLFSYAACTTQKGNDVGNKGTLIPGLEDGTLFEGIDTSGDWDLHKDVLGSAGKTGSWNFDLGSDFYGDVVVSLKAANGYAAYLFENVDGSQLNSGLFAGNFDTGSKHDLSHMTIATIGKTAPTPNEAVPEPFSMIGAGLALGAGALLKNRKK
ncbi:MAG: PEP-CTERM sorting domain-containing protein [Spirulinaceae cyanobacterium]